MAMLQLQANHYTIKGVKMGWSILCFGKHKGKTLPQVVFTDPGWVFYLYSRGAFQGKGSLEDEAEEIYRKACFIRIPGSNSQDLEVEQVFCQKSGKFVGFKLVSRSPPLYGNPPHILRSETIDMSIPHRAASYDRLGYSLFLRSLKSYLFGDVSYRMTRRRCDAFFENDENFVLNDLES
jgi:hypothetical protein